MAEFGNSWRSNVSNNSGSIVVPTATIQSLNGPDYHHLAVPATKSTRLLDGRDYHLAAPTTTYALHAPDYHLAVPTFRSIAKGQSEKARFTAATVYHVIVSSVHWVIIGLLGLSDH